MTPWRALKQNLPWWAKMGIKVVLSRLPLSHSAWRSLGLFEHGRMGEPAYALDVFLSHHKRVASYLPQPFTALELGPGDSLATAIIAYAHGAKTTYLVDVGAFAASDFEPYRRVCRLLESRGFPCKDLDKSRTVSEMLDTAGATYLVDGLESLHSIPMGSVDLIFSQAVLEHIVLSEFTPTIKALYEIQSPGGVSSHRIDLRDHLGDGLHSLLFSQRYWESRIISSSGFYTNRLRCSQIVRAFQVEGFEIVSLEVDRWDTHRLARSKLHSDFSGLSDDDLLVRGVTLVARKPS